MENDNNRFDTKFIGYEELEDRLPVNLYTRGFLEQYMSHCRRKSERVIGEIDIKRLSTNTAMKRGEMTILELIQYTTRHTQHHAAQLGLRLQRITGDEMRWIGSGWA